MNNSFYDQLVDDVNKLVGILRDEEQLIEILKRRLTKKEFKYYKLRMQEADEDTMLKELNCDKDRFDEISKQTILKINQEKIKKELVL